MWRILGSIGIVVACLLLFPIVLAFVSRVRIRTNFDYAMRCLARRAVWLARKGQGVTLDYSPASIEEVEKLLGELHNGHVQTPIPEAEISRLSARWGAYIGEVMKRVRPAKWRRDSEKIGLASMPLIFDDVEAFPCAWAYKRIVDGPDDNVVLKFKVVSDQGLRRALDLGKQSSS